jgi:hypothetical protein
MSEMKASDPAALQYLMTEDIYLISEEELAKPSVDSPESSPSFNYLGENNKFMLLLIQEESHPNLRSNELEALANILGAKRMSIKDVAIVNQRKYSASSWKEFKAYFACSSIVLFGIDPQEVKIRPLPKNVITDFEGMQVLFTYSFAEMLNSVDKKREFWNQMKKL